MRGEKKIEFDFSFQYSENGSFAEASSITVRAPGLGKYDVHTTMQSFIGKASLGFRKAHQGVSEPSSEGPVIDDEPAEAVSEKDHDENVLMLISMGLSTEEYQKFTTYLYRALTNCPKLASVGDTKEPVTEAVWLSIEENGGIAAFEKVVSAFVGFFLVSPRSQKTNGRSVPTTSASPPRATSPTSAPRKSRSQN